MTNALSQFAHAREIYIHLGLPREFKKDAYN